MNVSCYSFFLGLPLPRDLAGAGVVVELFFLTAERTLAPSRPPLSPVLVWADPGALPLVEDALGLALSLCVESPVQRALGRQAPLP